MTIPNCYVQQAGNSGRRRREWLPSTTGLLGVIGAAILLVGCGGQRPVHYYQISYPTAAPVPADALNTTLQVRPFEASTLYLDTKIVYGTGAHELGTYQQHRWAEPPIEILQDALVRGLRSAGIFRAVYTTGVDTAAPYVLSGHVYDFKEVDNASIVARLTYEVRLRNRKTGDMVWTYTYSHDEPVSEKTVSSFVEAMDQNVHRSVSEVQAGLLQYFRDHPLP